MKIPFSRTFKIFVETNLKKMKLNHDLEKNKFTFSVYRYGMVLNDWDEWTRFYLPINVKDKTVLDVGAGEGETAYFYLKNGAKKVICIEPDPTAFKRLAANADKHPEIIAINEPFNINMVPIFKPDLIKVDIEGYEEILLNHLIKTPAVIEVHGLQLRDRFASQGWQIKYTDMESSLGYGCCCYATKTSGFF